MASYLERWQRIGLVVSLVWALGAGYWGYELGNQWSESAREDAASGFYQCLKDENLGPNSEICEQRERELDRIGDYRWPGAALLGLGPIFLGWVLAYLARAAVGRRKPEPISE
jgi:hypothetical protein